MANQKPTDLAASTMKVHELLRDLTAEERHKVVSAVMTLFGDSSPVTVPAHVAGAASSASSAAAGTKFTKSLATYLAEKQALNNQTVRFLATADWLRQKSDAPLSTAAVTNALRNNNQSRLGNAPDVLNKNAAKGFVEKDGKTFFITPEGLASLGHKND